MPAPMPDHPHGKAVLEELMPLHRDLRHAIPDVMRGFADLSKAVMADGALDRRTKELIALAIGVVEGCDGCVASHARAAVRAGATRQQAAEAIGVAVLMDGGPATVHGSRAYSAFCEFADAAQAAAPTGTDRQGEAATSTAMGSATTGSATTGSATTGTDRQGEAATSTAMGPATTGSATTGSATTGSATTGSATT